MLPVPIQLAVTCVHAMRDTLVMDLYVKVNIVVFEFTLHIQFRIFDRKNIQPVTMNGFIQDTLTFNADIDECLMDIHDCAVNATCTNMIGSYMCTCNKGYIGDGFVCEGKHYGV